MWDAVNGKRSIPSILAEDGIDLTDWFFIGVSAVSDDGKRILGSAQYLGAEQPNSQPRPFVLRLL